MKTKNHGIFTVNNPKIEKGLKKGYFNIILHFSPSRLNNFHIDLCPFASDECRLFCLDDSGMARVFPKIKKARRRKTNEFLEDRKAYLTKIQEEIRFYNNKAKKLGLTLAVRLNGTSDIFWSKQRSIEYNLNLFETFPDIIFYDYTKNPHIVKNAEKYRNYDVTFSYSGKNWAECQRMLENKVNVAMVFDVNKGQPLPLTYEEYEVIDGDIDDNRFLDKKGGVIVGLRGKGKARSTKMNKVESNFLISIESLRKAI